MKRPWFDLAVKFVMLATILFQNYVIGDMAELSRRSSASMQELFRADKGLKDADDELKAADARLQRSVAWCQGEWH